MLRLTARYGPEKMGGVPVTHHGRPETESRGTVPAGQNLVSQLQVFLNELSSPLILASFASGIFLGRAATAAFLARSSSWTLGTALGSQAIGLGTEIAGVSLSRRLGAQVYFGAEDQWKPEDVANEMLTMVGPFALLRGAHQLFSKIKPVLASVLPQRLHPWVMPGAALFTDLGAVVGGHLFNRAVGLEKITDAERSLLYSGLLTLAHMRIAGEVIKSFSSPSLDYVIQQQVSRLRSATARPPRGDDSFGEGLVEFATAGGPSLRVLKEGPWDGLQRMMGEKNSGRNSPKTGESQPPPSSDRSEAIEVELGTRVAELQEAAAQFPVSEQVQDAARGLQGLVERYSADPNSAREKSFGNELSATRGQLRNAEASGRTLLEKLAQVRKFIDLVRNRGERSGETKEDPTKTPVAGRAPMVAREPSGPVGGVFSGLLGEVTLGLRDGVKGIWNKFRSRKIPQPISESQNPASDISLEVTRKLEEVVAEVEAKEQQGTQMQEALKNLEAVGRYLRTAAQQGLSEQAQWSLNKRLAKLKNIFPNFRWDPIPWARATGESALRRNGVVLGLGTKTSDMSTDTTLARRLRGEGGKSNQGVELDRDLEVLQQSFLLGACWSGSSRNFNYSLDRLMADYGVGKRSEVAARLAAETTHGLVTGQISQSGLMEFLRPKIKSGPLESDFASLEEAIRLEKNWPAPLFPFTVEVTVENYFLSSLGLVVRSTGEPTRFKAELKKMDEISGNGFHPSVALGLYGAVHGEAKLTAHFLPKDLDAASLLGRAQEEFFQGTLDSIPPR